MNEETEHPKPTRHLATQAGCGRWTPIAPRSAIAQDGVREEPVTPSPTESAVPAAESKPD
ncbi:MAG: hypothetical protein Q8N89_12950 [Azonexus sp.]|nr:hypothetical protein [Azonexus sp.]